MCHLRVRPPSYLEPVVARDGVACDRHSHQNTPEQPGMKKALIPVAVLAAAGAAHAQSSVTLFGVIDAAVEHASASGPGSSSITQLTNSGLSSSRIGIRGVEDIGGGNSASFWLEGSLG